MKRHNNPASMFIHFPNATILKSAIVGVAIIPGAYPNQPPRTRIITTGSFPVDVAETLDEVLIRWKGESGVEEARRHALEARVHELESFVARLKSITDPEVLAKEVQCASTN